MECRLLPWSGSCEQQCPFRAADAVRHSAAVSGAAAIAQALFQKRRLQP